MITLGGHVSCAGGPLKALQRAVDLEFGTMQIHPTGPQSWSKPTCTDEEAGQFAKDYLGRGISSVFFHNIYLTNFASESQAGWHGSIEISKSYMELAANMGARGIVTHLGSHKGAGMEAVLDRLVEGINRMLDESPEEATFLIENTAGAGGSIGRSLEEIQMILDRVWAKHTNVKICIDTCHAFASGMPIHTQEGLSAFVEEFKRRFGLETLACIHLNDSKHDFGSYKDRHENIGKGFIGDAAFSRLFHHPDLQEVPFIMEVPGLEDKGPDAGNRDHVRKLAA